jgi:hypothetical protein
LNRTRADVLATGIWPLLSPPHAAGSQILELAISGGDCRFGLKEGGKPSQFTRAREEFDDAPD